MRFVLLKAAAVWLLLVVLAILNGAIRESVLLPALGGTVAQPTSGIVLSLLIFLATWLTVPWLGKLSGAQYGLVGFFWLLLTVVFEFAFGYFVVGKSLDELIQAYDVTTGDLWVLVLIVTAVSPYLAAAVRGRV